MVHSVKQGKTERMSYSRINEVIDVPNLIEIQRNSYEWFLNEGIQQIFDEVSPVSDAQGIWEISFLEKEFDAEKPTYNLDECREKDSNYAAPLKIKIQLRNKETNEIKEQEAYVGDFPIMTEHGTFVINGAERVIISQIVRSPGAYFGTEKGKRGETLFTSQIIPNRGAWLELEEDENGIVNVRVDRTRKFPMTIFLRALGLATNEEIINALGDEEKLHKTMEKDLIDNREDALIAFYSKVRPGDPASVSVGENHLHNLFFDPRRYDLARVGIYKINKKLGLASRLVGHKAAENVVTEDGELLVKEGDVFTAATAQEIEDAGISSCLIYPISKIGDSVVVSDKTHKVVGNGRVDCEKYIRASFKAKELAKFDMAATGINERVRVSVLREIIEEVRANSKSSEYAEELKWALISRKSELMPKSLVVDDILAMVSYYLGLPHSVGSIDDIDHLGNRRIRSVGELLQNQMRTGMARVEKNIRERLSSIDEKESDKLTPTSFVNTRPLSAAFREFFGSSQLSQFGDQQNPLAELTHKRRLSALGPGGLSRDRASFEVRDINSSHYGRMCPIETPEGPNIGLITSLATFAKVNEYGFIETPYRYYDKENGVVTDQVKYMTADEEDLYNIAQANEPLDENNKFVNKRIVCRHLDQFLELAPSKVDYMDVSPKQLVSVSTSLIPFLGNDDANRALMGSNMQRQAVPLIKPEAPIIGTGMEYRAAKDSGSCKVAKAAGVVSYVSSDIIRITRSEDGVVDEYKLAKYQRSNQSNCINQRPIVSIGEEVAAGDVIADGPSTDKGELALGKNILIGFTTWEGYNYEDAVLVNERIVRDDVYTSIHIEEHVCEARDTKLGPEEFTREIPNTNDEAIANLDENGIIRIGAEVRSGDILVGKVSPKGETDPTAEQRLYRAIFGERAREVRDTSLRLPHGESGVVVDVDVFTKENNPNLKNSVNKLIRVYIAQKRKLSVGDKMAGRHGNKGVVSRILPEEDMPFLPDGTTLDIVLNPLGVPSRMNIGQLLEVHLGRAARALNWKIATPVFDGATEADIQEAFDLAGIDSDGKTVLYDGRTGQPFENRVTVGVMYYLKLHHLVDDKMHARSIGPYSIVTQQPLGGKAQFGGQRFGEMEVWALEAYGAAHTLQEILTVKSDDIEGRSKTYDAIIRGKNVPASGVPESFNVLTSELKALALDVTILTTSGEQVSMQSENNSDCEEADETTKAIFDENSEQYASDEIVGGGFSEVDENGEIIDTSSEDGDDDFGSDDI